MVLPVGQHLLFISSLDWRWPAGSATPAWQPHLKPPQSHNHGQWAAKHNHTHDVFPATQILNSSLYSNEADRVITLTIPEGEAANNNSKVTQNIKLEQMIM